MHKNLIEIRRHLLEPLFDGESLDAVIEWLIASEHRRPVVLVGAGFTRNAWNRQRNAYATGEEVPLWANVVQQMAAHLRVTDTHYDAPSMADMYVSAFGEASLRDFMRSLLLDDALEPAAAHEALADYEHEAIITTNLFDTLLDKQLGKRDPNWNRVVVDSDLSAQRLGETRQRDLIYFHGHRASPDTWVLSRSQYEDIAGNRPVIVARVRQLLAQHPLLIVGFGLSDPNLHNVYRQASRQLRGHQPVGLAIQMGPVPMAERRHWEQLGIRIAFPKDHQTIRRDPQASNVFFSQLFDKLGTISWLPPRAEIYGFVRQEADHGKRLDRFVQFITHAKVDPVALDHYEAMNDEFRAWEETLHSILSEDDKKAATKRQQEAERREHDHLFGPPPKNDVNEPPLTRGGAQPKPDKLKSLPKWVRSRNLRVRQLDLVFQRAHVFRHALARYFLHALDRGIFHSDAAERSHIPWMALTFWLCAEAGVPDLVTIGTRCIEAARKYGDDASATLVVEEGQTRVSPLRGLTVG